MTLVEMLRPSSGPATSLAAQRVRSAAGTKIVIEPPRGWRALDLAELWQYRELLWVLTERDIKVRYKQTVLGFAWAIIRPAGDGDGGVLGFFGRLAKMPADGVPYPVFVYAGLLPWTFFANAVSSSGDSLVSNANLISKVYFPRLIIPGAVSRSGAGGLRDRGDYLGRHDGLRRRKAGTGDP